ncbi:unnamed protein product [Lymnaea stagnalis]|uniref:serine--tRNA ligase n=1 Tax=Lymnaea stagnalis TaxID=6523 RepID=A0AAV2ILY8_LYMST
MLGHSLRKTVPDTIRIIFCHSCFRRLSSTQTSYWSLLSRKKNIEKIVPCNTRQKFHRSALNQGATQESPSASSKIEPAEWDQPFQLPEPELDWPFLLSSANTEAIDNNISNRKGIGDIHKVLELSQSLAAEQNVDKKEHIRRQLLAEALDIPNMSHPNAIIGDESKARVIELVGELKEFKDKPRNISEIAGKGLKMLRHENLTFSSGSKTYYLEDELAELERAIVSFTIDRLFTKGFELVSVPDLLYSGVINSCGFKTTSGRSQVYQLHDKCLNGACLAGTAEMSLAGYFMNETIPLEQLPKRMMAVSRCYRAEAAEKAIEKGLYRVHHFTKVEMFGLTANEDGTESEKLLQEILSIEKELFSDLGLHFRILDMPTQELGAPAHKKFDIEAWMYGKQMWGEISSCSNCTDYQSRRLNIKYMLPSGHLKHVHTVNGTACAVPRMITSILEQNQQKRRKITIPKVLQPYLNGKIEYTAEVTRSWYTYMKTLRRDPSPEDS